MQVVVCPDAFKGGPTANEVAAALAGGWREARPGDVVVEVPLADGGEGTLEALATSTRGRRRVVPNVTGPAGRPVDAAYLLLPDGTAVVEFAASSGLPLLGDALDPLGATSRGVGEVIAAALDAGARRLLVGLGGSASTDGGAGLLAALGARFLDADGDDLPDGGGALRDLDRVDLAGLRSPPPDGVEVLTDVTSPLLGPTGAAAVFGPQKGADAAAVEELEAGLARLANALGADPELPGAGAAGGAGYGLSAAFSARLRSGGEAIAAEVGLADRLAGADLVITGEGRFDVTSLRGKVVGTVLALTAAGSVRTIVVGGAVEPAARALLPGHALALSLTERAGSAEQSMARPEHYLRRLAAEVAADQDDRFAK